MQCLFAAQLVSGSKYKSKSGTVSNCTQEFIKNGTHTVVLSPGTYVIYAVGGGGAGGSPSWDGSSPVSGEKYAGGGGGGAFLMKRVTISSATSATINVGAGGLANNANGGNGGNTSVTLGDVVYMAGGGHGGHTAQLVNDQETDGDAAGGSGGMASHGDINGAGGNGGNGHMRFNGSVGGTGQNGGAGGGGGGSGNIQGGRGGNGNSSSFTGGGGGGGNDGRGNVNFPQTQGGTGLYSGGAGVSSGTECLPNNGNAQNGSGPSGGGRGLHPDNAERCAAAGGGGSFGGGGGGGGESRVTGPTGAGGGGGYVRIACEGGTASATGDPHLRNIRGKKFDIHDGLHTLVHYPRGSFASQALLKIDAKAVMMPGEVSCYNVFFQEIRLSGKWVGEDIILKYDGSTIRQKSFVLGMRGQYHAWKDLSREVSHLKSSGTEPIEFYTKHRHTTGDDLPGGDEIEFSIGRTNPVIVEVWSSQGSNELTHDENIQYLNMQVHDLPKDAGGLLGLDSYDRPAEAKCGLTQQEDGSINDLQSLADIALLQFESRRAVAWRMSALARND